MPSDRESISTEEHELNYLLKKYEKRQTEENREILTDLIKEWKGDAEFAPHNRDSFYDWVDDDDEDVLEDLEDVE